MSVVKKNYLFLILISFLIVSNSNAEKIEGRVGQWPPQYFLEDGQWRGSVVDAYRALEQESGVEIELVEIPWSRAIASIEDRSLIMGLLTPTEERSKIMSFIGPHDLEEMRLIIHKDYADRSIENLDDLVGLIRESEKKIAYQQDTFYCPEFNERIQKDTLFKQHFESRSILNTLALMTEAERILGFFEDKNYWKYLKKSESGNSSMVLHPFLISRTEVYFGVSQTIPSETLEKLKEANDRLISNGTYLRIREKWDAWLEEE